MIKPGSQILLTFPSGGRFAQHGRNSSSKQDIARMMSFGGVIDPETGKFEKVLNVDWYINHKKPFPKHYWWDKKKYEEPTYHQDVVRKIHWDWETHIEPMLHIPIGMSEKQWNKLPDEMKMAKHAEASRLPGEDSPIMEIFI